MSVGGAHLGHHTDRGAIARVELHGPFGRMQAELVFARLLRKRREITAAPAVAGEFEPGWREVRRYCNGPAQDFTALAQAVGVVLPGRLAAPQIEVEGDG